MKQFVPESTPSEEVWEELMEEMAEQSLSLTDTELEKETSEEGVELLAQAESVRTLLLDEVRFHRQRFLRESMEAYAESVLRLKNREHDLPKTAEGRREMLSQLFQRFPQMQTFLTIQHRDFKSVSDTDVESFLRQLDELGVLEDLPPESGSPSSRIKQ